MKELIRKNTRFISDGNPKKITAPKALKQKLATGLLEKYEISGNNS